MQELIKNIKFKRTEQNNHKIVESIATITDEEANIMIDANDIKKALNNTSVADTQVAQASGKDTMLKAMQTIVEKIDSFESIESLFIRFDIHPDVSMMQIMGAMEIVEKQLDKNASIVFGSASDKSLEKEYAKVSVLSCYK